MLLHIAGTGSSATGTSYTAGQLAIGTLLDAVPEFKNIAHVTGTKESKGRLLMLALTKTTDWKQIQQYFNEY